MKSSRVLYSLLLVFFAVIILAGCETTDPETGEVKSLEDDVETITEIVKDELSTTIEQLKQLASKASKQVSNKDIVDVAKQEKEKLFTIEYKVVDIPLNSTAQEIENRLNDLGKDRWDCFYVRPTEIMMRLVCKRRPISYLRYLLGAF